MKKNIGSIFLLLTILFSCGEKVAVENDVINSDFEFQKFNQTNPEFNSIVSDYIDVARRRGYNVHDVESIPINFYDLENIEGNGAKLTSFQDSFQQYETQNAVYQFETEIYQARNQVRVGVCIKYTNGTREILINKEAWNDFSDTKREILIFHELGHCSLDRSHDDSLHNNHKTSVMHSILLDENIYNSYYDEYIIELFTEDKTELFRVL